MLSRIIPLEYLKERDVMFWLPPGGQDNDVWADTWVIIAELDTADAEPVLDLLHDNDIGAYVARPSGLKGASSPGRQLYVDREQYTRAIDVLMLFLRRKDQPVVPARVARKPAKAKRDAPPKTKPRAIRILLAGIKIAAGATLLALAVLLIYYKYSARVQHAHHPVPNSDVPSMQGTKP